MIRVGLIDDDLEHQKMICEFINTYKNETNTNFEIVQYTDGLNFYRRVSWKSRYSFLRH